MFKMMSNFTVFMLNLYLIKLLVMFLYGGPIFHPNFHPKTLVLLQLTQFSLGLGVSGVAFTVLLFPGLVKYSEGLLCSMLCSGLTSQSSRTALEGVVARAASRQNSANSVSFILE